MIAAICKSPPRFNLAIQVPSCRSVRQRGGRRRSEVERAQAGRRNRRYRSEHKLCDQGIHCYQFPAFKRGSARYERKQRKACTGRFSSTSDRHCGEPGMLTSIASVPRSTVRQQRRGQSVYVLTSLAVRSHKSGQTYRKAAFSGSIYLQRLRTVSVSFAHRLSILATPWAGQDRRRQIGTPRISDQCPSLAGTSRQE